MPESEPNSESVWWKAGATVLAVVALLVSIRSCVLSQEALSLSQTSFVTTSRPYLLVSPYKPREWDSFIKCSSVTAGTQIAVAFRIKNAGTTPAYATRVDEALVEMHFTNRSGKDITDTTRLRLKLVQPDGVVVGPNESYQLEASLTVDRIGDQTGRIEELLDRGAKLPVEIHVSYDVILGKAKTRHTSITKAMLYTDRSEILSSEVR